MRIESAVKYFHKSPELEAAVRQLPDYVTVAYFTQYQSVFQFECYPARDF